VKRSPVHTPGPGLPPWEVRRLCEGDGLVKPFPATPHQRMAHGLSAVRQARSFRAARGKPEKVVKVGAEAGRPPPSMAELLRDHGKRTCPSRIKGISRSFCNSCSTNPFPETGAAVASQGVGGWRADFPPPPTRSRPVFLTRTPSVVLS
jgi:hypothetical protein